MADLKVGLQLYSVRDDMGVDMDSTLAQVKAMGYDYVEFAGYFGKSAEEVKALLDKHGLQCVSVHQKHDVFLEKPQENIDFLKTIGAKYCAIPWMGLENHKGSENFEKTVEEIKKIAKLLKDNGIQMLYHNHDFEYEKFEDKFLLDWLYDAVPSDLLKPEFDTCWVKYAGYDPCEQIGKHAGDVDVVHLKDFVCKSFAGGPVYALIDENGNENKKPTKEENGFEFRPVGKGIQNFAEIIEAAKAAGTKYIIVEQDQCPTATPLESVKQSREYLKNMGY